MLNRRISNGALDVAFTSLTDEAVAGVRMRELHREPVIAIFLPSDPLSPCRELTLADVADRPLITLPEDQACAGNSTARCGRPAFKPTSPSKPAIPTYSLRSLRRGWAWVSFLNQPSRKAIT